MMPERIIKEKGTYGKDDKKPRNKDEARIWELTKERDYW